MVKLPFRPLWRKAACETIEGCSRTLRVPRETVHRWMRDGIPGAQADRLAAALGCHPSEIWPREWEGAIAPAYDNGFPSDRPFLLVRLSCPQCGGLMDWTDPELDTSHGAIDGLCVDCQGWWRVEVRLEPVVAERRVA